MKNKDVIITSHHTQNKCLVDSRVKCENKTTSKLEENHVIIFIILNFLIMIKYFYHKNYFNYDHKSGNHKKQKILK